MKRIVILLLIVALNLFLCSTASAQGGGGEPTKKESNKKVVAKKKNSSNSTLPNTPTISDGAAASIVAKYFNENAAQEALVLGKVSFGDSVNHHQQSESLKRLPLYRAFADAGMITFSDEQELGASRVAVVHPAPSRSEGVIKRFPRTASAAPEFGQDLELLIFQEGRYRVKNIATNEGLIGGSDQYRVVMGTYAYEVRHIIATILDKAGFPVRRHGRFRILLKQNPFEQKRETVVFQFDDAAGTFPDDVYSIDRRIHDLGLFRR